MNKTVEYIKKLTSIASPTGYTKEIMQFIFDEAKNLGYEPSFTNKGAVIIQVKGSDDAKQRMLTAHCDTLGAMVREIKADGRLKLEKIGGYAFNFVEGENCLIHVGSGDKKISGTILMHQTSTHVYKDAATAERNAENIEVRLDEKVLSKEDTEKLGIGVGDFVSFDPRTVVTESGFIKSRHLDDKVSAAILLDILSKIAESEVKLAHTS